MGLTDMIGNVRSSVTISDQANASFAHPRVANRVQRRAAVIGAFMSAYRAAASR